MIIVILPVSNVSAQQDGFEYFVPVPYIQRIDDDMDGYFETARIHYDVDSTVAYAEIRVVCSVFDETTSTKVKDLSDTYTIFRQVDIKDTYFDFRAGYSGTFNFSLAVYDVIHNHKEYGGNDYPVGNTTLEVDPNRYHIIPDATAYDADGDGYNDDVRITVRDIHNYTLSNASIYIGGNYVGVTNSNGEIVQFNFARGIHEVDAFYSGLHGNTDFKSEGTGQENLIYVDVDPFDSDQDGYIDDVLIRAYTYNFYPLPNAQVYIDFYYYGNTDQNGLLYAYNFGLGFHPVRVTFRNLMAFSSFYAEAEDPQHVDIYFSWIYGQVVALDIDELANDLDIYMDVDVYGGGTANVTVNATVYYENRTVAATGSINYTTTGYEIEEKHIYIYNLTENMTYSLRYELFNETGYLEDVWYQYDVVIQIAYGLINVDKFVYELNDDDHLNDVIFWAHIKDQGYLNANIKIYWQSNNTLAKNLTTSFREGYAIAENLLYANYTWIAYDESNNTIDNGTFELYDRNPFRTVQVLVQLYDSDYDNFYDDFEVLAYNELGLFETNVSVRVVHFETSQIVTQGYTSGISPGGLGRFLVEDLQEGYYTYSASIVFGLSEYHLISSGWFYSYGNSTESTHNLNAFALAIDFDNDGYKNDVQVRVTDRNGIGVMNAIVYYDNDIQNQNLTDQNGYVIGRDFEFGWHDVDVIFLGSSPTVPTGSQAHTRFYSEGINYDEYFIWANAEVFEADADGEWNDLNVTLVAGVDEWVEVEVTVEIEIHYSSNNSLLFNKTVKFFIYGGLWIPYSIHIYNLTYNEEYFANYTLKDQHGMIEDEANQTKIIIIPINPLINIDLGLFNNDFYPFIQEGIAEVDSVSFYAHIFGNGIYNVTIEIYYKSNDTKVATLITNEFGDTGFGDLPEDDYYFIGTNSTNHTIEYGEFKIGEPPWINELETDYNDNGYYDDFFYRAYEINYTDVQIPGGYSMTQNFTNVTVIIYNINNQIVAQGDTNNIHYSFVALNLSEGHYKYIATYKNLRIINGTFYSYGNGFLNREPVVEISQPANNSAWLTTDTILFDGSSSYDPDNDIITFYWFSNRTVNGGSNFLSTQPSFSTKLPAGVHKITLAVDDGHGHNITESITVTVTTPVINETNDKPIANAGSDQINVPVNTTVTLDGSGSSDSDGYITEYNWSLVSRPVGSTAALNDSIYVKPTFYADKLGTYTWSLGVKDNKSEWSVQEDTVDVIVIKNQMPMVNISLPLALDIYNTTDVIFFESNGTYDPDDDMNGDGVVNGTEQDNLTYQWTDQYGNGTPVLISVQPNFNSTSINSGNYIFEPGTHFINLTVIDLFGANATTEVEINITNVPPIANITSPEENETFRKYKPIRLDGRASEDLDNDTADLYFYWEVSSPGMTTLVFENDSYPLIEDGLDEGDYTATLWVDDSVGTDLLNREHNASTLVNFTVENRAPIADAGPDQKINLAEIAFFNASDSWDPDGDRDEENFTYEWDLDELVDEDDDGNFTNDKDLEGLAVNHTYLNGGTYVITLTVSDGSDNNEMAADNLTLIVNRLPEARAGDDIDDAEVDEDILLDGSDSYDDDEDDVLLFQWTFEEGDPNDDTGLSTSPFTNVTYDDAGEFIVTLNVSDGFGWATDSLTITVIKANSPPVAVASISTGSVGVDIDQIIYFSGDDSYDPDTGDTLEFTWDFGDGSPETTGINVSHSYSENGQYIVTLNVTDGELWANDTLTVIVIPPMPVIEFPDEGDNVNGIVIVFGTASGNEIKSVQVQIAKKVGTFQYLAGPWINALPFDTDDWSQWSYEWKTENDDNGEYQVAVRTTTDYSQSDSASINVMVTNEDEPEPLSITIDSPRDGTKVKVTTTIEGTTTGEDIVRVEVKIGSSDWVEAEPKATGDWSEWSYDWDTTTENNVRFLIKAQVTTTDGSTESDSVSVTVDNEVAEEETAEGGGIMDLVNRYQNYILIGIIILIILIIILVVTRKSGRKREREAEELLELEEEEGIEGAVVAAEMAGEEGEQEIIKQPIRCPKCQEYSVIEDDGERPLMVECVHCGSKGYISAKPKSLGAMALPGKYEKEEEKLIIQCPKCDEMFTADDETGEIVCPNCGTRGKLNEETIEELKKTQVETLEPQADELVGRKPPELPPTTLAKGEKRVRCPNCDTKFGIPVDSKDIECPSCGATGSL